MLKRKFPLWTSSLMTSGLFTAMTLIPSLAHAGDLLDSNYESSLGSKIAFVHQGSDAESFKAGLQLRTFKNCEKHVVLHVKENEKPAAKGADPVVLIGLTLEDKGGALQNCIKTETAAQGGDCKTKPDVCTDVQRQMKKSVLVKHEKKIMKFVFATTDASGELEYDDKPIEIVGSELQKELDAKLAAQKKKDEEKEALLEKEREAERRTAKAERKAQEQADLKALDKYLALAVECARGNKDARDVSESAFALANALGVKAGKEDIVSAKLVIIEKAKAETELREVARALKNPNLTADDLESMAVQLDRLSHAKVDKRFPDKVSHLYQDLGSKQKELLLETEGLNGSYDLFKNTLDAALEIEGLSDRRLGELKNIRNHELPYQQSVASASLYGWSQNRDLQSTVNAKIKDYSEMARKAKSQEERALALRLVDAYQALPTQAVSIELQRMNDQKQIEERRIQGQLNAMQAAFAKPQGVQPVTGIAQVGNSNASGSALPFIQNPAGIQAPQGGVKF